MKIPVLVQHCQRDATECLIVKYARGESRIWPKAFATFVLAPGESLTVTCVPAGELPAAAPDPVAPPEQAPET